MLYVSNPKGMDRAAAAAVSMPSALNEHEFKQFGDPETLTRISQYELAFRMQMAVPDVMEFARSPRDPADDRAKPARRHSPTIACWPAGWSSEKCATFSSSTGAGTATARARATTL